MGNLFLSELLIHISVKYTIQINFLRKFPIKDFYVAYKLLEIIRGSICQVSISQENKSAYL